MRSACVVSQFPVTVTTLPLAAPQQSVVVLVPAKSSTFALANILKDERWLSVNNIALSMEDAAQSQKHGRKQSA